MVLLPSVRHTLCERQGGSVREGLGGLPTEKGPALCAILPSLTRASVFAPSCFPKGEMAIDEQPVTATSFLPRMWRDACAHRLWPPRSSLLPPLRAYDPVRGSAIFR